MPGYIYILKCSDGSFYTGSTKDLEARLYAHQVGKASNYTSKRLPVQLVYAEEYDRIDEAFSREHQIKKWSRKKKQALINGNFDQLKSFARNYSEFGPSTSSGS